MNSSNDSSSARAVDAAGIVPPLRNPEAEKCAQELAAVIHDKVTRQAVFAAYRDTHPNLKNWEAQAIGQRACSIAKAAALAKLDTPRQSRSDWEGAIYNELETLTPCTRSDAQAIADGQQFVLAQQWALGASAKDAAAAVLKSATVKG